MNRAEKTLLSLAVIISITLLIIAALLYRIETEMRSASASLLTISATSDAERKQQVNDILRKEGLPEIN